MAEPLTICQFLGILAICFVVVGPHMYKQHIANKEYKAIIAKRTAENQKKMWSRLNERS